MPYGERLEALREGRIVGQEGPLATARELASQGLQPYVSLTNHAYRPVHLVLNKAFFDSLPADLQGVLLAAARDAARLTRRLRVEADRRLLGQLQQAGVAVAPADRDAFLEAVAPVWEDLAQEVGGRRAAQLLQEMARVE